MPKSPEELRLDQRTPCGFALTTEFAQRVSNVACTLPSDLTFKDLRLGDKTTSKVWTDFIEGLSRREKSVLIRALGSLSCKDEETGKPLTIGEIRKNPPTQRWFFSSTHSRWRMQQVTADFLTLAFGHNQSEA